MAIRNTSIVPFKITSIPDRFTMVYIADKTLNASTAGTGGAKRLNRLQSGSFSMDTAVTDVIEMGSQFRPGGIDDLGEVKWQLSWNAVGLSNIAALTGVTVPTGSGTSITISTTTMQAASIDFIRLVADVNGNVFGTLYMQDCIVDDYSVDAKEKGLVTEHMSGRGPTAVFFPGYIIPEVYIATSTDVTNGYLSLGSLWGADEQPVQIFLPAQGTPPSYYQQNGSSYFLKVEKVPSAVLTNAATRYFEHVATSQQAATSPGTVWITPAAFTITTCQVGQQVTLGINTANTETVTILTIAQTVNTNSGSSTVAAPGSATITPVSMAGIEVGVSLLCDTVASGKQETVAVTAITSTTFTATFAQTHSAAFIIVTTAPSINVTTTKSHVAGAVMSGALNAAQNFVGNATFLASTNKLYLGDTFVAGDMFRIVFLSYNTDSLPTSVPTNPPDTTDRAGVTSRLIPLTIGTQTANRVQSASFKVALKRDHVQGIGENKIVYGISSVPDVTIDLDVKETDLSLLSQLQTGSKNLTAQGGTIQNDFEDINYITRENLAVATPTSITLFDPFNAANILCTWKSPQLVVKSVGYSSTNKSDNTIKVSAMDITGNFTINLTNPD